MTAGTTAPADDTTPYGAPAAEGLAQLPSCGDFDIRIAANGQWFYRGSPIGRKPLVKLFSTVLRREEDGRYWLVTPVERGEIIVDDAAFVAEQVNVTGSGQDQIVEFTTNIDAVVPLDADHPLRVEIAEDGEPRPYIHVHGAPGRGLEALILRSVYYHLIEMAQIRPAEDGSGEELGLWSAGQFHVLGRL